MKKSFVLGALAALFVAVTALAAVSCSDASNEVGVGMVSFYVDKTLADKAIKLAGVSRNEGEGERKLRFEVALEGEYSATKTAYADYEGERGFTSFSIDFADIPLGKTVWAKVKVYDEQGQTPEGESRRPTLYGKSNTIQVSSGTNSLSVDAYSYLADVPYKVEIQFDWAPDFSACDKNIVYAVDPASKFVAKLKNAKDDLERYDICNDFAGKYMDAYLGEMNLQNAELSYSEDKKTVTAQGNMSLYISEDDPSSRAVTALFVLISQNSNQTKYYGMANSAMTPMKKQENLASFSAAPLGFADTRLAMYRIVDWNYGYYFTDNASDSLAGEPAILSSGISGMMNGPYEQSSCFDANGNFYSLSITPDSGEGEAYIKSNNPVITSPDETPGSGTYDCKEDGYWVRYNSIACDIKNNELFIFQSRGDSIYGLYGTGDFIKTGNNSFSAYMLNIGYAGGQINVDIPFVTDRCFAVCGGTAYFAARSSEAKTYLLKADLSKKVEAASPDYDYVVDLEIVAEIPLPDENMALGYNGAEITDMICQNGAVYLLLREKENHISNWGRGSDIYYNSRGALIKFDLASKDVKTIGWTENPQDISSANFATYNRTSGSPYHYFTANCSPDWTDASKWFRIAGDISISWSGGGDLVRDNLPKIYSPTSGAASNAFYNPQKFIALKPKKLVIADNGAAFYTENGGYRCKNAKRVVTVDLEKFAISDVTDNDAAFLDIVNESIYTSAFGNINNFISILSGVDLYVADGTEEGRRINMITETSENIYLGIPFDGEN